MKLLPEAGGDTLPERSPGWRCTAPQALHCMAWDQEAAVVYDERSGDTHLLDALAAQALLELIRQGQATRAELAQLLRDRLTPEERPNLETALDERLARLLQRALIEPWLG